MKFHVGKMMEIPDVVSVRKFKEFNEHEKEELYETLLELTEAIDEIHKKSLRKTLHITLAVLQYKGEQAAVLQEKLDAKSPGDSQEDSYNERLLDENEKLKRMLDKLEDEKLVLKDKIKELTAEILQVQKRLQDTTASGEGSDKDSSDPLSELDKQEELLRNINTKNKHIKRLLREIEALQNQNIEQSKTIIQAEKEIQQVKAKMLQLSADITLVDSERKALKDTVNELNIEITRLEGNITYLEEERERSEKDLKDFIEKLELKAQSWKNMLDEKDNELKKLRARLEKESGSVFLSEELTTNNNSTLDNIEDAARRDTTKMLHAIESRDKLIEQLERKIKTMAEEMLASTKLMNKLSVEKEDERNPQKPRSCCKIIEASLHAANNRSRELSDMLERSEEDNLHKSKQAMKALAALEAYQRGEDGLAKSLRKCTSLENKIVSRDKQIRALVMELNSMHEITHENGLLRKRLNIPDDVFISTKNLAAKERSKEKIIDRLTLKLRASEEMRLQLKLEKSDLRKEMILLQKQSHKSSAQENVDSLRMPSEIGEVEDSIAVTIGSFSVDEHMCINCKANRNTKIEYAEESIQPNIEMNTQYQDVLEENETLRLGMHEILEKLREYDASSDHITIDTEMLYRLLQALQSQPTSSPETPKRLRKEVKALKEREVTLRDMLKQTMPSDSLETDELASIESMREDGELRKNDESALSLPNFVDSSTRPATPNRSFLNQTIIPVITDTVESIEKTRRLEEQVNELQIYRNQYEELTIHMSASELELTRYCKDLVEQVTNLKLNQSKQSSSYAYMRADFDDALTLAKQNELRHIQIVADLNRDHHQDKQDISRLEAECNQFKSSTTYNEDEYRALQKTNVQLEVQLANIVEHVLSGKLTQQLQITEICTDYGIIRENMQVDYITVEEFEQQRANLRISTDNEKELLRKSSQLEGLLEIAQNQIQSQQKLINEITDNHINLRHLVSDLQSTAEGKLLIAKMQRDLDNAKSEVSILKMERDDDKQKCETLQIDLKSQQQTTAQLHKNFQTERNNKDIKIKFLQKSLYALKEKYSKFTPLIFLTNFVYAYTKFAKKSTEPAVTFMSEKIMEEVQEIIISNLQGNNQNLDESQNLIKLIKTETQCKLLEENISSLQNKCDCLQHELTEQRLNYATGSEHWKTIEALFSQETLSNKPVPETEIDIDDVQWKDVATNTEAPIPAERKTSAGGRRKSLAELIDKNMSPIGTPVKKVKNDVREFATQTSEEQKLEKALLNAETTNETAVEILVPEKELESQKQTTEAEVQTSQEYLESQAVQTMNLKLDDQKEYPENENYATIENQLKEALKSADERGQLLKHNQLDLEAAKKRIEELEKLVASAKPEQPKTSEEKSLSELQLNQQSGVIEKTILSFHTLLSEKDKSISKYQDLLQNEREQAQATIIKLTADNDGLKNTVTNLNFNIKTKDMEILELKTKLETVSVRRNSNEKLDLATGVLAADDGGDNSLNELTDEKIEEMFQQDGSPVSVAGSVIPRITLTTDTDNDEKQDTEAMKETSTLIKQIKELKDKTSYWEKTLKVKDEEVMLLREKVNLYQDRERSMENTTNPEMEQLRVLLEEKDRHINDLMETLNNFHDDQQRFINDSSNYSADQIAKLAADLTRTEATNKIYQTQVEALRRQLTSLTQREKQTRELNQSLRNQLIKRPVVSIKTELNARTKNENLQKRIQQLELELEETRAQIQRQQVVIEAKRARSASEVGLWEKQKRWQQTADKFKAKLEETECALEKTRSLLQSARTTINRLEKDKQVLEVKLGRATHGGVHNIKCCRTPSCPNLHHGGTKYTPSESPETYTGGSSECSSPAHSAPGGSLHAQNAHFYVNTHNGAAHGSHHGDIIEALKARIELQQRKIIAMEGKGTNALANEMEKIQERFSATEAQNIRLEAKNLQLQLDNDLLRQGNATDRLQKQIKHLEDYIIALKEEMAHTEARRVLCKCSGIKVTTQQGQSAEQTILSMRRIVEKLRAENKYLKDGRRSCESRSSSETPTDLSRLQQMYAGSVDKIAALQVELNAKSKCANCSGRGKVDTHTNDELTYIKEQLIKKTQLLQKAKVLLTRAAAKEKVLKEQLALWKRKCSELQNVPVIDEISE